jgi:hypothetical protein
VTNHTVLAAHSSDPFTVAAIAVLVYLLAAVIHEGIGHGATCALVGGKVNVITSVHCDCEYEALPRSRQRMIEAGGTAANLFAGLAFAAALILLRPASPAWRYFLLLSALVNLFQAGGYLMVSPFAGFGDWQAFLEGIRNKLPWKLALTGGGILISVLAAYFGQEEVAAFCGGANPRRSQQAWLLTALPYVTGALVSCAIAFLNPVDKVLVVTSAGAATLGGTFWLLWVGYLAGVHVAKPDLAPAAIEWNPGLIALALAALVAWAATLGPGISFAGAASPR